MTAVDIVKKYHRAWTSGDIDAAMSHVADDISCRAPGGDIEGKAAYREYIGAFAPKLIEVGEIAEFAEGDRVALFYYPRTEASRNAPAAECFTVRDGRIVENILIFDRLSFMPSGQG